MSVWLLKESIRLYISSSDFVGFHSRCSIVCACLTCLSTGLVCALSYLESLSDFVGLLPGCHNAQSASMIFLDACIPGSTELPALIQWWSRPSCVGVGSGLLLIKNE